MAYQYCPYCGVRLKEKYNYCPMCGKILPDNQANEKDQELFRVTAQMMTGDFSEADLFFELVQNTIYGCVVSNNVPEADRDDVCQEIAIKILQSIGTLHDARSVKSWIRKISTTTSIDTLRSNNRRESRTAELPESEEYDDDPIDSLLVDDSPVPEDIVLNEAENKLIQQAIESLDEDDRRVISARFDGDMKISEIAVLLEMNVNTVKSRLRRSEETLKNKIEQIETTEGIRLHSIGVVPLLILFYHSEVQAPAAASAAILSGAHSTIAGITAAAGVAEAAGAATVAETTEIAGATASGTAGTAGAAGAAEATGAVTATGTAQTAAATAATAAKTAALSGAAKAGIGVLSAAIIGIGGVVGYTALTNDNASYISSMSQISEENVEQIWQEAEDCIYDRTKEYNEQGWNYENEITPYAAAVEAYTVDPKENEPGIEQVNDSEDTDTVQDSVNEIKSRIYLFFLFYVTSPRFDEDFLSFYNYVVLEDVHYDEDGILCYELLKDRYFTGELFATISPDDLLMSVFRRLAFTGYTDPKDGLDDYRSEDETIISCEWTFY